MAKATAIQDLEIHPKGWWDVEVDGYAIGWRSSMWATVWPADSEVRMDRRLASGNAEADVRWILEQIPGCADLEIEWVNE